jgi:1-acyl-sn-glycerol-3-phosphate acyltransferase
MIAKIRAILFIFTIYLYMALLGTLAAPYAMISRNNTYNVLKFYCKSVFFFARWIVGIKVEIRGTPPEGGEIVVSKHQSFLDILMIFNALPRPKFIMKREILYTPFIGVYAKRVGSAPVKRGAKGAAIKQMLASIEQDKDDPGQLVIFPQGTRVLPGDYKPYKIGAGALYEGLKKDCIPAATNVGLFWPKNFVNIRSGRAVVEFLPVIPAGKPIANFMKEIEQTIETESDRLMAEGGSRKST